MSPARETAPPAPQIEALALTLTQSIRRAATSETDEQLLALVELAAGVPESVAQSLLARHPEWRSLSQGLGPRYADYILRRELEHTERMLREGAAPAADGFAERTYARVTDMFEQVDFGGEQRLVMVGCGPFPATILHALDRTDQLQCLGLDSDARVVALCQRLIEARGLSRFQVQTGDGRDHDFSGASIIYVANLARPKGAILARVAATARPGTAVILRDPYALGVLFAEAGVDSIPAPLEPRGVGLPEPRFLSRHVFLRRTGADAQRARARAAS